MSKIIDIQPQINPDGYFEDNISTENSSNMLLFQKIAGLKNDDNFSQEDNTILSEVIENHKNLIQKKNNFKQICN